VFLRSPNNNTTEPRVLKEPPQVIVDFTRLNTASAKWDTYARQFHM
jgi:hypothetical protein